MNDLDIARKVELKHSFYRPSSRNPPFFGALFNTHPVAVVYS